MKSIDTDKTSNRDIPTRNDVSSPPLHNTASRKQLIPFSQRQNDKVIQKTSQSFTRLETSVSPSNSTNNNINNDNTLHQHPKNKMSTNDNYTSSRDIFSQLSPSFELSASSEEDIKIEETKINSRSQQSRPRGGPVDLDDGNFVDVQSHLQDIYAMAALHLKQEQYDDAIEVFSQLLDSQINHYGENHKRVASTWHNLGVAYSKFSLHKKNDKKNNDNKLATDTLHNVEPNSTFSKSCWLQNSRRAIEAFEHAIRVYKNIYGEKSIDQAIATSLVALGFEHLATNSNNKALQSFQEALQIRINALGKNDALVAKTRNNIAITYIHLNRTDQAKKQMQKVIEIQRHIFSKLCRDNKIMSHVEKNSMEHKASSVFLPSMFQTSPSKTLKTNDSMSQTESIHKQTSEVKLEIANSQYNLGFLLLDCAIWKKKKMKTKKKTNFNEEEYGDLLKSMYQDLTEAEAALSDALSIRISILGEMNPLIEPTRKKFELSRYLLRKNIAKQKSKEVGKASTVTKDGDNLTLDKIRNAYDQELNFNDHKISVETSTSKHKETEKMKYLSIRSTAAPKTPLVRNSKSILPRTRLESFKSDPITTSKKTNYTALQSNATNRIYHKKNVIHSMTNFEESLHNIDLFDFLSKDNNVTANHLKGDEELGIVQNNLFVKTLEDDDCVSDSDNSDSDDSAREEQEMEKKLSSRLSNPEANMGILYAISSFFSRKQQHKKAIDVLTVILNSHIETYGEQHHLVGSCFHNMGITYLRAKLYENAKISLTNAIRIRKKILGKSHLDVASSLVKLGIAYLLLQNFDLSLLNFNEALLIRSNALGHLDYSIALIYNNIGCTYVESFQLTDACSAFERALEIQRAASVNEPENKTFILGEATTLINLGHLYSITGQLDKSGVVLRDSILLQESVLGNHHSKVLSTMCSLAQICIQNNNNTGGLRWYNSLLLRLKEFRPYNNYKRKRNLRRQVIILYKLSRVHLVQNDKESALQRIKSALELVTRSNNVCEEDQQLNVESLLSKEIIRIEGEIGKGKQKVVWI